MGLDTGTRLGPYEILAPLGSGGMGEVYIARDTRLDRQVAVKVLPAGSASTQALERFEREAKAIAALNHPGICAVYDVGTSPVPFLVMELLDGETLHQRLARARRDVPALLEIGLTLADALASAHAKGIIHRDLKPANIVLTPRGPKILDFGLARIGETVAQSGADPTAFPTLSGPTPLTDAGVTVGTVAYMSPEQLRGEALDARTDLFSLGPVVRVQSLDDPGGTRVVTADRVRGGSAEISPDGRWIAFAALGDRNEPVIAVCDLETCSSRKTFPPFGQVGRWMPDGQGFAYVEPRAQSDLWVQPLNGGPPRPLTQFPADGNEIWDFDWSADGKRLAVARARMTSDIVLFRGLTTKK